MSTAEPYASIVATDLLPLPVGGGKARKRFPVPISWVERAENHRIWRAQIPVGWTKAADGHHVVLLDEFRDRVATAYLEGAGKETRGFTQAADGVAPASVVRRLSAVALVEQTRLETAAAADQRVAEMAARRDTLSDAEGRELRRVRDDARGARRWAEVHKHEYRRQILAIGERASKQVTGSIGPWKY